MHFAHLNLHCLPSYLLIFLATFPSPAHTQHSLNTPDPVSKRSFLTNSAPSDHDVQDVLEHQPAKQAVCSKPTGPIETTLCDYESVESVNNALFTSLAELVKAPFFKYFRTDLYRECPFWQENGFCMNRECGITTVDESEVPPAWRAAALSKVEIPTEEQRLALPGCYYRDSDFCFLDDVTADGDYIDLTENPERFTGYSGPSAHRVWASIYDENCFGISERSLREPISETDLLGLDAGKNDKHVCEEKRVYYRIISGLHASISVHICRDGFNQSTGEWGPNLHCFIDRIASHPERLHHIYFNTVLLLRAVARLSPYLSAYNYCSTPEGVHEHEGGNIRTKQRLQDVMDIAKRVGRFDESVLFRGENANVGNPESILQIAAHHTEQLVKEEFKDHFRNVSRIMDCVGCDKCRLWGKVQVSGLGTALKVLFELDEKALDPQSNPNLLQRSEVVALINTLHRFTESLEFVDEFRKLWAQQGSRNKDEFLRSLTHELPTTVPGEKKPSKARPSLFVSPSQKEGVVDWTLPARLKSLLHACRQSTTDCVHKCARVVGDILSALGSLFRLSGKDQGPKSEL